MVTISDEKGWGEQRDIWEISKGKGLGGQIRGISVADGWERWGGRRIPQARFAQNFHVYI